MESERVDDLAQEESVEELENQKRIAEAERAYQEAIYRRWREIYSLYHR